MTSDQLGKIWPIIVEKIRRDSADKERARILGIRAALLGEPFQEFASECEADPNCSVDAAQSRMFELKRWTRREGAAATTITEPVPPRALLN